VPEVNFGVEQEIRGHVFPCSISDLLALSDYFHLTVRVAVVVAVVAALVLLVVVLVAQLLVVAVVRPLF